MDEDFLRELFASVSGFRIRRMFGGQGRSHPRSGRRWRTLSQERCQDRCHLRGRRSAKLALRPHPPKPRADALLPDAGCRLRRPGRSEALDRASRWSLPARGPDKGRRKAKRRAETVEIRHPRPGRLSAVALNCGIRTDPQDPLGSVRRPPAACVSWPRPRALPFHRGWPFPARGPSQQAPVRYGETGRGTCARNAAMRLRDRSRDSARD